MDDQLQQLEETARRCRQLALECYDPRARKVMRLLALDLFRAADDRRRATVVSLDYEIAQIVRHHSASAETDEVSNRC
jgi:hypothetical protein